MQIIQRITEETEEAEEELPARQKIQQIIATETEKVLKQKIHRITKTERRSPSSSRSPPR